MKAIVQTEYGSPDVLSLQEVEKPLVTANSVLVKVRAASVNAGDWHLMRGDPFPIRLMFGGILNPKINILGMDVAGSVEAVGKDVTQFQVGDEVFGDLSESGFGAFAEYVCGTEATLMKKEGTYVLVGGSTLRFFQVMLFGSAIARIIRRQVKCLASKPNRSDLIILKELIEAGKIVPFIDRTYNLSEVPTAIRQLEQRQVRGKVAISV